MPQFTTTRAEIAAGQLDRRVVLLRPTSNEDNDEMAEWSPVATVWAAVLPGATSEIDQSGREVASAQALIVIRYRADVDARWRVQDGQRTYEITGLPRDVLGRRVQLQLVCEEVE